MPRPLRSSRLRPAVPRKRCELDWLMVLLRAGRSLSRSPTEVFPVWNNSSPVTVVMGTLDSRLGRAMREPVTTTS